MQKKSKILILMCIITVIPFFSFDLLSNSQNNIPLDEGNLRLSAGTLGPMITKSLTGIPTDIFIEDANNDGFNDIITTVSGDDNITILLWNTATNDWDEVIHINVSIYSIWYFFVGDANNDGFNDIVIPDNDAIIYLWNNTISDWDNPITRFTGPSAYDIFIGDANNDGYDDLLLSIDSAYSILPWNESSGDWDAAIVRPSGGDPEEIYLGDANNDGFNDIVSMSVIGGLSYNVTIDTWNNNLKDWDPQIILNAGEDLSDVFVEDANNDGFNDIIACNSIKDTVSIFLWNDTSSNWNERIKIQLYDSPLVYENAVRVFVADVNNDNLNDIVTANLEANTVSIFPWNDAIGDWENEIIKTVGTDPTRLFVGDANNDGYNDIVTSNHVSEDISILLWHEKAPSSIFGYEITFLLIIISVSSVIIIKKSQKKIK